MKQNRIQDRILKAKRETSLNLSSEGLNNVPLQVFSLTHLEELSLSSNKLTCLPHEISKLKNLKKLYLFNNQLTSLPSEISDLNHLTELYLNGNRLTQIPTEISKLKSLIKLHLAGNKLTKFPDEITELENLTELDLSKNQLMSLPVEISKLRNLEKLDLRNNELTSLPRGILELNLYINWKSVVPTGIFIGDNPFEYPPVEIVEKGRKAITDYFNSSQQGDLQQLNEVKVLLVGDGGAGKTSLVKKLFGEEVDGNEPQTQGIKIRKWVIKDCEREIKVNFWDFGGQEIMHATHQFFLSERSLYILVLDGRKDEKPEYWLKLIENFGGDSPVLVVINKIDQNPSFELNRRFLIEKYPSIRDFYRLSCVSNEGIEYFSKELKDNLTKIKHLEIKWPKSWFNVKEKLEKIQQNYVSDNGDENSSNRRNFIEYKEYELTCNREGVIDESEQNTLVDFLHDLGVIIHFKDIPLLGTHVLEPEWVTGAVYKIINSAKLADRKGVMELKLLNEILKKRKETDYYYPRTQHNFIINLMKKFELCYEIDLQTVLMPDLLEIEEPEITFDYSNSLKFILDYDDFLPKPIMPRFIVRMNEDIKDDLQWRTGVVLEDQNFNSSAVIKSDNEAKKIYIFVNGEQKRDYLSVILFNFHKINEDFKKLVVIEKVPMPSEPNITVSYSHLMRLEKKGVKKYLPDGSDTEYDVGDLLGNIKIGLEEMTNREILQILCKLKDQLDTEETLRDKFLKVFSVGIGPIGINLNELAKLVITKKN